LNTPQRTGYAASLGRFCAAVLGDDGAVQPYCNNYTGGHSQALQTTYPCIHATLGGAPFGALARVYVQHYPPVHWDLNLYGETFPTLLAAQARGRRAADFQWQWLACVAAIEYAITRAYYAQDRVGGGCATFAVAASAEPGTADIMPLLQQQHPFVVIEQDLSLQRPVAVWRDGLRIWVSNESPRVADHSAVED
jgi:hypothetical protein